MVWHHCYVFYSVLQFGNAEDGNLQQFMKSLSLIKLSFVNMLDRRKKRISTIFLNSYDGQTIKGYDGPIFYIPSEVSLLC